MIRYEILHNQLTPLRLPQVPSLELRSLSLKEQSILIMF